MIIRNKFNGYAADGTRLYPGGGGGGQTTSTSYQTNIPEYARPYVEQMLGATQRQLFSGTTDAQGNFVPTGFNNFTPYGATYQRDQYGNPLRDAQGNTLYTNTAMDQARAAVAPMARGQQQAIGSINQYVAPSQTQAATGIAGDIAGRSAAAGYYNPLQAERFQLGRAQQVAANRVNTDSFTSPYVSRGYMSPYMQNVVNVQQREARRAGEMQRMQNQAQAVGQGAYGGSRQAIVEAERQRNLGTQLGDIQAQGLQQAYQQGMGQFNAEQQAYLQAQMANQQAGLTAQQANQQANLQVGIQNLQAQQAAQAAQEASRQYGAGLGLQGYGQSLQAAHELGGLGQQEYAQDMGIIQAQYGMGAQEQAQRQAVINQAMQNYATMQQYPLMQLGVMSNMLRGLPMQASTTQNYQAQPSYFSQGAGAIGTGLGLYQQYQKAFPGQKEGGVVKMASGGIATGVPAGKLGAMLKQPNFSDDDLQKKAGDPQTDQATKDLVAAEIARRANLRAGMANGGIIAFKKGDRVKEDTERLRRMADKDADEGGIEAIIEQERAKERARNDIDVRNAGILQAAGNVSPVPSADRTTAAPAPVPPPAAAAPAVAPEPQGGIAYRDREQANLEAGLGATGIKPEVKPYPLAELEATTNEEMLRQKALRDEGKGEKINRYERERTEAGVPDIFQLEKEKLEARRKRGEESERETAKNNLIRFLTKWGTIPGSTMRGLIGAGAELVDKMDLDEKQKQKFLNELDDIDSRINSAEYSRRIGDEDRAQKEKEKAGELYFKLGHDLRTAKVNYAIKQMDAESKYEIAALKAEVAANKAQNKAPIIQMADKEFEGLVAEGMPANAVTYKLALKNAAKMLPGVQAAEIGYGPRAASAGADVSRAATAEKEAATRETEAKRKQLGDYKDDLYDAERAAKKEIKAAKTPEEKRAIKDRIKREVLGGFDLLTPKDVGLSGGGGAPAAAPSPPAGSSVRSAADAILSGGR